MLKERHKRGRLMLRERYKEEIRFNVKGEV
jgi:hypothetical protein